MLGCRKSCKLDALEAGLSKGKPMERLSGYFRSRMPQYEAASLHAPTRSCSIWGKSYMFTKGHLVTRGQQALKGANIEEIIKTYIP